MLHRVVFFFFFQAEDGIRDVAVTGVQTCALPILDRRNMDVSAWRPRNASRAASSPGRSRRSSGTAQSVEGGGGGGRRRRRILSDRLRARIPIPAGSPARRGTARDRKSTRLNSSHGYISY